MRLAMLLRPDHTPSRPIAVQVIVQIDFPGISLSVFIRLSAENGLIDLAPKGGRTTEPSMFQGISRRTLILAILAGGLSGAPASAQSAKSLLNVSYDPTRELYVE